MIVLDINCENTHRFEGWFASAEAFRDQRGRGLVACPHCGSCAETGSCQHTGTRTCSAAGTSGCSCCRKLEWRPAHESFSACEATGE
jgi:hypothetical protein